MRALVCEAMADGALDLSTGLFYVPGSFTSTEEVIALAEIATVSIPGVIQSVADVDGRRVRLPRTTAEGCDRRCGRSKVLKPGTSGMPTLVGSTTYGDRCKTFDR